MKTFKDLEFKAHPIGNGHQARIFFSNGYGVSVVRFKLYDRVRYGSYTSNENEWELAILYGDKEESILCYNTDITDDVIGHLTADEVTDIMKRVQEL